MVGGVQISLVLDMLSWRSQLRTQVKISSRKLDLELWHSGKRLELESKMWVFQWIESQHWKRSFREGMFRAGHSRNLAMETKKDWLET